MTRKIFSILAIAAAVVAVSMTVSAQGKNRVGRNARLFDLISAAKEGRARLNPETAAQVRADFTEPQNAVTDLGPSIVGTWNCDIAESDTGLPPFQALQTFNSDGTFVETSSLLGGGGEGPAHGVYERVRRGYILTFELFVFDPSTGESVGRVRVRASIRMRSSNDFTALTAVDFIEPDGTVIPDIDGGPFAGSRLHVRGI